MQPYFLPFLGYFQLINSVDKFIFYDNDYFKKGGWINRNRLRNNIDFINIPCVVNTPSDIIKDRFITENKLLNWGKKNRNDNTNKIRGFFNSL